LDFTSGEPVVESAMLFNLVPGLNGRNVKGGQNAKGDGRRRELGQRDNLNSLNGC